MPDPGDDTATRAPARRQIHWLIALPLLLILLISWMVMQHGERKRERAAAAPADATATVDDRVAPAAATPPAVPASDATPAPERAPLLDLAGGRDAADVARFRQGMDELQRKRPKPALAIFDGIGDEPLRLLGQAMAQHDMRHASESQLALERLVRDHADAPYLVAQAYAWRGQKDEAFLWLDRAVVQRDGGLADVKYDPVLRNLREDARYPALLARIGPQH